ncbi:MAG: XRE family transcriptional regulator [Candidatus Zixiibacteriota bacterium]
MESSKPRKSPIISSQLRKARELLQFNIAEVSNYISTNPDYIERWEKGEETPSVKQLEVLAKLYGREIDYFLRDTPTPPREIEFRGKSNQTFRNLTREAKNVIARFDELCRTAFELEQLLKQRHVVKLTRFNKSDSPDRIAESLRKQLSVGNKPIPHFRDILEKEGARIFELPVPNDEFSGLSFWHSEYGPAILLNAKELKGRRNFTLAHELAHLLYDDGSSVCYVSDASLLPRESIERKANQVAIKLLLPAEGISEDFLQKDLSRKPQEKQLGQLAGRWGVSIQALGYRLEDLGLIEKGHTDQLPKTKTYFRGSRTPRWERQLGKQFVMTAMDAYHKGLITSGKLSHALGITFRKTLEEIPKRVR